MSIKKKLYLFLKKYVPKKIKVYLYFLRDIKKKFLLSLPNFIFKYLIIDILDKDKKKIFTLRNFPGSTAGRGLNMFRSDPEVCEWIDKFNSNSTLIDIGANIGVYSLYAAKKNHNVLSFEPESLNFACLNLNVNDNNLNDKITSYPISLNDTFKISKLNLTKMKFGGSGNTFDRSIHESGSEFNPVYKQGSISLTLDNFLEISQISPSYIKIDVDGNELKVINGMKNIINDKNLKSICIELNPKFDEHNQVLKILENNFKNYKKHKWYEEQSVFNYTFER